MSQKNKGTSIDLSLLSDFQKKLSKDSFALNKLDQYIKSFVRSNDVKSVVDNTDFLIKSTNNYTQILPLFHFDESFWLAQSIVKIFRLKNNDFFSSLNLSGQLTSSLRSGSLPNFEFYFISSKIPAGGYYFKDAAYNKTIFYLDLQHRRFFINPRGLIDIIESKLGSLLNEAQIRNFTRSLNLLADSFFTDEFALDLNIIQPENDAVFEIESLDLPAIVTDKLFIASQANQVDIFALDNGFQLNFSENIKLLFVSKLDNLGHSQWYFRVIDENNSFSFFDLLANYSWFRSWYLENIDFLQIVFRKEIFNFT
ncbi:hypothetical protein ACKP2L_04620 [Oenococcus alcoholitolerans]|uniref:hypothetical protein n=1 Tax=Oenococcus alcoholitolerans TaxID=931074 RepID=UPI003F6E6512